MEQSGLGVSMHQVTELNDPGFLDKLLQSLTITTPSQTIKPVKDGAAFMKLLSDAANRQKTQNDADAYASTLSPTVDAFNGLSQATDADDYEPLLRKSWEEDPLITLKITFNLRSIHEGKSEREGYYRAWGWLYRNHPKTAIINLRTLIEPLIPANSKKKKTGDEGSEVDVVIVDIKDEAPEGVEARGKTHGYWKDLLNLLVLASDGALDHGEKNFGSLHPKRLRPSGDQATPKRTARPGKRLHKKAQSKADPTTRDARIASSVARDKAEKDEARTARHKRHEEWNQQVSNLLEKSPPFKALYVSVARLIADGLSSDLKLLEQINSTQDDAEKAQLRFQMSLCAKYAPSLGGMHDKKTNIATSIAELLWREGHLTVSFQEKKPAEVTPDMIVALRDAYRRQILSPLRQFLQLPERYMSSNKWNELPYKKVASTCMQKNKKTFYKHDEERFSKYVSDVAAGKLSISGATLLPHTLLAEALAANRQATSGYASAELKVIEGQWNTLVEKMKESGTLGNCIAICDVSGSMGSINSMPRRGKNPTVSPIFPAVALSMLVAKIAREPWANSFITFSLKPEVVKIDPTAGFVETAQFMCNSDWGMNTDFNAVFTKLILPLAIEHKLPKEEMIKRLFVFSDMEFDQSMKGEGETWKPEHDQICKAFAAAGYDVPEIVYWNLQGAKGAKPVLSDREGVAMLSGFSGNLLKTFLDGELEDEEVVEVVEDATGDEELVAISKPKITPESLMKKALNRPSYATLVVVD